MLKHTIIVLQTGKPSSALSHLKTHFNCTEIQSMHSLTATDAFAEARAVIVDFSHRDEPDFVLSELLVKSLSGANKPVVCLSSCNTLRHKLKAFELGFDDFIGPEVAPEETEARITRVIYNQIANEQLESRLSLANETAYSAMADNSDLGSNIQFLLDVNRCDNLDELGQTLLRTMSHYDVSCSLQLRSLYGTKNMEANGMARELESQLLDHMKDAGRYVDFGRRTICNYGQCSILVRNMPLDNEKKYGALKDNTFALIQGVDARIKALDEHRRLVEEKAALQKMSLTVQDAIKQVDESYQNVMREIVDVVEDMAESIQGQLPAMALCEEHEVFFDQATHQVVQDTSAIFNEGLKVDEAFKSLSDAMEKALERAKSLDEHVARPDGDVCYVNTDANKDADDGIELF